MEGLRGLAALVVLLHHVFLGFSPSTAGYLAANRTEHSWIGSPLFAAVNGTGAVIFFFVLSGFVLPRVFMRSGDISKLWHMAAKRLPRLYVPVLLSVLFSWLLFALGLYAFAQAGQASGSEWLADFGYASLAHFSPTLGEALLQSITVFIEGYSNFNSVLWTMRPELIGSYVCLAVAVVMMWYAPGATSRLIIAAASAFLAVLMMPLLVPFIIGTSLAVVIWSRPAEFELHPAAAIVLIAVAVVLLSYVEPVGFFAPLASIRLPADTYIYVNGIGAAALLIAVHCCSRLRNALSGRTSRLLGRISFPLYLVHMSVLASIGCHLYLEALAFGWSAAYAAALAGAATVLFSLAVAVPFAFVDQAWLRYLGSIGRKRPFLPVAAARANAKDGRRKASAG